MSESTLVFGRKPSSWHISVAAEAMAAAHFVVIPYGEHSTDRSRIAPTGATSQVQLPQSLEGIDDIINHVNQSALAVLGVSQSDDPLIEVNIGPL